MAEQPRQSTIEDLSSMFDKDLEVSKDNTTNKNTNQSLLNMFDDEINTVETELERIYLYHLYNIDPQHYKFFVETYGEHICSVVLHNTSEKSTKEDLEYYTSSVKDEKGSIIPEIIKCPKKKHFHIVVALPKVKSYYTCTENPSSKWYGWKVNDRIAIQVDEDTYVTKQQIWLKVFPDQDPYKMVLVEEESHYQRLLKYFIKRYQQYGKGTIEQLKEYTSDKYYYGGRDPRTYRKKKGTITKNKDYDDDTLSSIDIQVNCKSNNALAKQLLHVEKTEVDYQSYKKLFLDKGYSTLAEWQQGEEQLASPEIKKIFNEGLLAEKARKSKPLKDEDVNQLESSFPLTTKLIRFILFHIVVKRREKDVFLILQGPPSCGKSNMALNITDSYPGSLECTSIDAFLLRDNLAMEGLVTYNCESIRCDEFPFADRIGRAIHQVQDQVKFYLCGHDIPIRTRKTTKDMTLYSVRIKLICACANSDTKRKQNVDTFLEDLAVKERTIRILYKNSYLDLFKEEKKPTNQLPLREFSMYAIKMRIKLESITEKVTSESIILLDNFIKDTWFLSEHLDISYNSLHSTNILDRLKEVNKNTPEFINILDTLDLESESNSDKEEEND